MSASGTTALSRIETKLNAAQRTANKAAEVAAQMRDRQESIRIQLISQNQRFVKTQAQACADGELLKIAGWDADKTSAYLEDRARREAKVREDLHAVEPDLDRREQERAKAAVALEQAEQAEESASAEVLAHLESDDEYQALKQDHAAAKDRFRVAMQKVQQADQERDEKAEPYLKDALFCYLFNRQFGTPSYQGQGLVARMDGWVARVARFHIAHRNFQLLHQLPTYLRQRAESIQLEVQQSHDRLTQMWTEASAKTGLEDAQNQTAKARQELKRRDQALERAQQHLDSLRDRLDALKTFADEKSEQALAESIEFIDNLPDARLQEMAERTESKDDDRAAAEIRMLREEAHSIGKDLVAAERAATQAEAQVQRAETARQQFKRKGYDSNRYRVDSGFDSAIDGFIIGTIASDAWSASLSRSVTRRDDDYSSFSSSSYGSSSSFGSDFGSSFSSSGSDMGSSFSTDGFDF